MTELQSDFDFHQLLIPTPKSDATARARGPAPAPPRPVSDASSYFVPEALSRSNSVYSFSRATFSSQIANLNSMTLPQAESLAASITALPTARKAIKALNNAADQIQSWTKRALKVVESLDADDDVEWAAAAGREGLEETETVVSNFENLVSVYVSSIEGLQSRPDVGDVKPEELQVVVEQMEITLDGWEQVRKDLKKIHIQVELAMEWDELWAKVLGEVRQEMDSLSQLVFEMEEKRHAAFQSDPEPVPTQTIDLNELESFMGGPEQQRINNSSNRYSLPPTFETAPVGAPAPENPQDDATLLSLFARMQPLRASLDFLPMRLSMFQTRAENIFPGACQELEEKRERLEKNWKQLSEEADNLRKELSEDRWVVVFRNAGRQAQKMSDSVERSITKVREALDEGYMQKHPGALAKRVESLEAKKMHYVPAIQRVLAIIQKGLKDRLTVNGEILRLHKDLAAKMRDISDTFDDIDSMLDPVPTRHNAKYRESLSSIMSGDRSFSNSTFAGTPGSSPASSIDLPPQRSDKPISKYGLNGYSKPKLGSATKPPPSSSSNKRSSLAFQGRRPETPSGSFHRRTQSPSAPSVYKQGVYTPQTVPVTRRAPVTIPDKPRWSSVIKPSAPAPAPTNYRYSTPFTPSTSQNQRFLYARPVSTVGFRSPLSRQASTSPNPGMNQNPVVAKHSSQQLRSFAERVAEPDPNRSRGVLDPLPYHRGRNITAPTLGTIRSLSSLAMQTSSATKPTLASAAPSSNRPPSSLSRSHGMRHSVQPRATNENQRLSIAPQSRRQSDFKPHNHAHSRYQRHLPDHDHDRHDPNKSQDEDQDHPSDLSTTTNEEDNTYLRDDASTEGPSSSPLTRKSAATPRPGSVLSGRTPGKRTSMLPLPVSMPGRTGSLGMP